MQTATSKRSVLAERKLGHVNDGERSISVSGLELVGKTFPPQWAMPFGFEAN